MNAVQSVGGGAGQIYGFNAEEVNQWRRDMEMRRDQIFRRRWQNPRNIPSLTSLDAVLDLQFVMNWYHESDELIERQRSVRHYTNLLSLRAVANQPHGRQVLE